MAERNSPPYDLSHHAHTWGVYERARKWVDKTLDSSCHVETFDYRQTGYFLVLEPTPKSSARPMYSRFLGLTTLVTLEKMEPEGQPASWAIRLSDPFSGRTVPNLLNIWLRQYDPSQPKYPSIKVNDDKGGSLPPAPMEAPGLTASFVDFLGQLETVAERGSLCPIPADYAITLYERVNERPAS